MKTVKTLSTISSFIFLVSCAANTAKPLTYDALMEKINKGNFTWRMFAKEESEGPDNETFLITYETIWYHDFNNKKVSYTLYNATENEVDEDMKGFFIEANETVYELVYCNNNGNYEFCLKHSSKYGATIKEALFPRVREDGHLGGYLDYFLFSYLVKNDDGSIGASHGQDTDTSSEVSVNVTGERVTFINTQLDTISYLQDEIYNLGTTKQLKQLESNSMIKQRTQQVDNKSNNQ